MTDNEVMAALLAAARDSGARGHVHAKRFVERQHFKKLYERNPSDQKVNRLAINQVFDSLVAEFGPDCVRRDSYRPRAAALDYSSCAPTRAAQVVRPGRATLLPCPGEGLNRFRFPGV